MKTATSTRPARPAQAIIETMRSIVQDQYGAAPEEVLRLADVARPTAADDEVLVRVHAPPVWTGALGTS